MMEIPLLTEGESKVYKALISLGDTSIGDILKISGVSHSKIYDILERLSKKGLVSSINKNGRQYFSPANPSSLMELVNEKKKELDQNKAEMNEIVKKLNVLKNTTTPTSILNSYQGIKGMKTVLDYVLNSLKKNDEVLILGTPRYINEYAGGYIKDWQKKRIKKGAKCRVIIDDDYVSWDYGWWDKSKKDKLTFTKKSKMNSPSYFVITKNLVATLYFSDVVLSLLVEHKDISKRYKEFFEVMWG
jgi:HTH-type transcriptional regulator, sugar sensing transcriptional regulator